MRYSQLQGVRCLIENVWTLPSSFLRLTDLTNSFMRFKIRVIIQRGLDLLVPFINKINLVLILFPNEIWNRSLEDSRKRGKYSLYHNFSNFSSIKSRLRTASTIDVWSRGSVLHMSILSLFYYDPYIFTRSYNAVRKYNIQRRIWRTSVCQWSIIYGILNSKQNSQ